MKVSISNFRGIKDANFLLGNITIIGGENGAGKTSIAQAIAAALTGEAPIKDLKKQDYKHLVRIGKTTANIEVSEGGGRAVMQFPEGKGYTDGLPPLTSVYAAGLDSPLDMKKSDAAECWISLLNAEPTLENLQSELKKEGAENPENVIQLVKAKGWDGAVAQYKEEGTQLKGRWRQITNEIYGTAKGESWKPEGFNLGDEKEALEAALKDKQEAYDESLKNKAVSEYERAGLAAKAGELKECDAALAELRKQIPAIEKELKAAEGAVEDVKNSKQVLKCPGCKKKLRLEKNALVLSENAAEFTEAQKNEIMDKYNSTQSRYQGALAAQRNLQCQIKECENAAEELNKTIISAPNTKAADELEAAKKALNAFDNYANALRIHRQIISYIEIIKLLAPEGLRKRHLEAALKNFNETLKELCQEAGWGNVAIELDLSVSYDEKPFALLSESEQYRSRCTIQAALAMRDNSQVLIFDRADLLTKKGRNGLFYLCAKTGLRSVMLLSANARDEIPALSDGNETYWVEDGKLEHCAE
jgi:gas vesicle protein